jgi:DNA-binding response OmpR family regulator
MTDQRILIVDDEEDLCEILQFNLEGEGYQTEVAFSAEEALKKELGSFHLVLLDVMMGKLSGFKLAKLMRGEMGLTMPIIFITAKTAEDDLLTGFNIGGDDYIHKPFSVKEVIVRVKAVLKRGEQKDSELKNILSIDDLELNLKKRKLRIGKEEVELTKKEFEILTLLIQREGYIMSREDILKRVWEEHTIVTERTIDVHLARLRKKLGGFGKYIKNKPGYGYTFERNS